MSSEIKDGQGREIITISGSARLLNIDWNAVEAFAQTFRYGDRSSLAVICAVSIAIREHVLETQVPNIPGVRNKE